MTKDQINALTFSLAVAGAVLCFTLGQSEAGTLLLAFAGGHAIRSPFTKDTNTEDQ